MGNAVNGLAALFGSLFVATQASAQTPAPAGAGSPAAATPPAAPSEPGRPAPIDTVTLKDGSIYRGTISELVAGDHVEIVLVTGVTKRFSMSDVAYAGPTAGLAAAKPSSPEEQPRNKQPSLHVTTSRPGVSLYRQVSVSKGKPSWETICALPCTTHLAPGAYDLGLGLGDRDPRPVGRLQIRGGASRALAHYDSALGTRIAGWVMLGVFLPSGMVGLVVGLQADPKNTTLIGVGAMGTGLGLLGGVMAGKSDTARLQLVPANQSLLRHRLDADPALDGLSVHGGVPSLSLRARF